MNATPYPSDYSEPEKETYKHITVNILNKNEFMTSYTTSHIFHKIQYNTR